MSRPVFYVTLIRRWVARRPPLGRWSVGISTTTERPVPHEMNVAVFEVECATKSEAPAIVMEWLATGEPAAMTVRRVGR